MSRKRNGKKPQRTNVPVRQDQTGASKKDEKPKDEGRGMDTKVPEPEKPSSGVQGVPGGGSARSANDPEWYNADPALLVDSASFPYAYPLGDVIHLRGEELPVYVSSNGKTHSYADTLTESSIPGVCSLRVKPTISASRDRKDPVNVCASAFYTHVRYVNSGRKNYDPSDLMMYALSQSDLISFAFWCQRLYGYMFTYSQRNKYIAESLVTANGVNYTDLRANLANFRYWLNAFINKIASWVVPANINLFKRRAFMYTGLYLENPDSNIKDQLYQFVPDGFYRFNIDSVTKFGMLEYRKWLGSPSVLKSVNDIISFGEDLLANITNDEDFGLMSGDILKAYGENIIGLGSCPEEMYIIPVHDKFVLSQFKNAVMVPVCCGSPSTSNVGRKNYAVGSYTQYTSGDIMQDSTGNLISFEIPVDMVDGDKFNYQVAALNHVLSVENPLPGPADSIEASRLMTTVGSSYDDVKYDDTMFNPIISGSEIVQNIYLCLLNNSGLSVVEADAYELGTETIGSSSIRVACQFKYCPTIYRITYTETGNVWRINSARVCSNIDNYTVLGSREISKMHECAMLSLFFVPGVAKMINYLGK